MGGIDAEQGHEHQATDKQHDAGHDLIATNSHGLLRSESDAEALLGFTQGFCQGIVGRIVYCTVEFDTHQQGADNGLEARDHHGGPGAFAVNLGGHCVAEDRAAAFEDAAGHDHVKGSWVM
ncbi:MAG: hypothetical protein HC888_12560 [Candidatus Competibacteraceae bacterium]|nr:hypothetical protein [Candidatus Competibacteraceae bacterium]